MESQNSEDGAVRPLAFVLRRGVARSGPQADALNRSLLRRGFDLVADPLRWRFAEDKVPPGSIAALPGGFEIRPLIEDQGARAAVHPTIAAALRALHRAGVPIAAPCMAISVAWTALPDILKGTVAISRDVTEWPAARVVTTSRSLFGATPAEIEGAIEAVLTRAEAFAHG